jgi:ligand-binding sensor domain-containing protein/signal transduction histidine kinase
MRSGSKPIKSAGLLLALWLVCGQPAIAIVTDEPLFRYRPDVWQTENGLPQNTVHTILQTRDGYLWLATEEGLARFDGIRFKVFDTRNTEQIRSKSVRELFEDREGSLWIGTTGGLTRLRDSRFTAYTTKDGLTSDSVESIYQDREGSLWIGTPDGLNRFRDGKFTAFTTEDGLPSPGVSAIHQDGGGTLWIGTRGGLAQMKDGRFTAYTSSHGLPGDNVRAIYEDRSGALWISTLAGLARLKDGRFTAYTVKDGLSNERVWSISEDRRGNIWVGTDGGLNLFSEGRFIAYTTANGLSDNTVWSISEDRRGVLWIGTPGGLNRFQDGRFTSYTTKEGLSDNVVLAVCEDREGSLWIGTEAGGLNRLKEGKFVTYTTADGLSSDLAWTICESRDGSLWIGTQSGGLNRFKDGEFSSYTTRDRLPSNIARALCEDREGNLWIGTPAGLARMKDGRLVTYTVEDGLSSNAVSAIEEGRDGSLWIGTLGGLNRLKGGSFQVYTTRDGLSDDGVLSLRADRRGNLWIGTRGGVLNRFKDGRFTSYTIKDASADDSIRAIYEDRDGAIWIGARRSGLHRLKDERFTSFSTREGLFDDCVFQILEDSRGNLWMSSPRGVFRASRKELEDFAEGKTSRIASISYDTADGMESRECNGGQPAGWRTRDGKMWFPTARGVAVIDAENLSVNSLAPPVVIEEIIVDHVTIAPGEMIELSPGNDRYEFHYAGLSLIAPEKVKYRYRLEGLEDDWIDAGSQRVAHYTRIPPGRYTFRVMAGNNDGVWNDTPASFELYLKPYFYQTWWFYMLGVAAVALAVLGFFGLRVRRMRAQFSAVLAERNRMAREIHDTLAQGFVGIGLQLKAVERALERDPRSAMPHLELARSMVRHSLAEARRTVWNLRSHALETSDLVTVLRDTARQMTEGTGVRAEVRWEGEARPLSGDIENNILRLCQEALTNAMKHAQAKEIVIELGFDADCVRLRVRDDGRGFDTAASPSARDGHFGLTGMRERVEQMKGRFSVYSRPDEGTRIEAAIPVREGKR